MGNCDFLFRPDKAFAIRKNMIGVGIRPFRQIQIQR